MNLTESTWGMEWDFFGSYEILIHMRAHMCFLSERAQAKSSYVKSARGGDSNAHPPVELFTRALFGYRQRLLLMGKIGALCELFESPVGFHEFFCRCLNKALGYEVNSMGLLNKRGTRLLHGL